MAQSCAEFGAARILLGRDGVIVGIVPVAAPLVDVVAHIIEAEIVGRVLGHGLGSGLPARGVVGDRLRRIVALIVVDPGKIALLEIGAGGALPLGFGWKTVGTGGLLCEPVAVTVCVEPGDSGYGLLGMIKLFILPEGWRVGLRVAQEHRVFGIRNLCRG